MFREVQYLGFLVYRLGAYGLQSVKPGSITYFVIFSKLFNLLVLQFLCLLNGLIRSFIRIKCCNLCKAHSTMPETFIVKLSMGGQQCRESVWQMVVIFLIIKIIIIQNTLLSWSQPDIMYNSSRRILLKVCLRLHDHLILQRKWKGFNLISRLLWKPKIRGGGEGVMGCQVRPSNL